MTDRTDRFMPREKIEGTVRSHIAELERQLNIARLALESVEVYSSALPKEIWDVVRAALAHIEKDKSCT